MLPLHLDKKDVVTSFKLSLLVLSDSSVSEYI